MSTMASDESAPPAATMAATEAADPFVTSPSGPAHLRYSSFDSQLFALGPGASAEQAKRALEAHLKETERRMAEAGKLGTALVQQQRELTERLREVEQLQSEGELKPELRQKLVDIEKDYNEVARESARAFLPKQRVPSNEAAQGSPYPPEGRGGRRSVSPSKFESLATGSPTKLSVPNRKLRNQPANRIHDIEFAAEISTSLISQVRNLQSLLAERDEELRDLKAENSQLEVETEALQQRMKTLDESEHRYKDENWNLETQIHELMAAQKEAADREKKLTQNLNVLQAEKNATQRELDEVKDGMSKQDEKLSATIKNLEIELGTSRRSAAISESERLAMQKKVDDLTSQNQELAKAFSIQRGRPSERESGFGMSDEDFESAADNITPEHSPPPSPIKGTPRHSMLESETLKNSLGHAQRTIQSLRTNVHREKTEKLELRRMLQEARDELEKMRGDPNAANRRSRKVDSREFKKPTRLGQLGGARSSRTELYVDDPNWEDHPGVDSSVLVGTPGTSSRTIRPSIEESSSDHFDTANETSDAAFETANEHDRGTETEDFQTGAEELSDDDQATETEGSPSRGAGRIRKRPSLPPLQAPGRSYSFHSTASTSADEDDFPSSDIRTPTTQPTQRMRLRVSRGALSRRSRQLSEEPNLQSSPASLANSSAAGTPQPPAQSLFAELGDLEGSDDDSYGGGLTPSRRSIRSLTPGSTAYRASPPPEVPALPKVIMVDSGMMTEPVEVRRVAEELASPVSVIQRERPMSMDSVVGPAYWPVDEATDGQLSRPLSTISYSDASAQHDPGMDAELSRFPSPPTSARKLGLGITPILPPPQTLSMSQIRGEDIEPLVEPESPLPLPPMLGFSAITSEHIEPIAEPEVPVPPAPALSMPAILSEHVEPVAEPEPIQPAFSMSTIISEHVEPMAEPELPAPVAPVLGLPAIISQDIEPVEEPEPPAPVPPTFSMPSILSEHVEPVVEPEPPVPVPPALSIPAIISLEVEPVAEPEPPAPVQATLSIPTVLFQEVEPIAEPEPLAALPATLSLAALHVQHIEPVHEQQDEGIRAVVPEPAPLSMPSIISEHVEPVAEPEDPAPSLSVSTILSEHVEPVAEPEIPVPPLSVSTILSEHVEPVADPEAPVAPLSISTILSEHVEPIAEPEIPVPPLSLAVIRAEHIEPLAEPMPPQPSPVALTFSPVSSEEIEPRQEPEPPAPLFSLSSVQVLQDVEPVVPQKPTPAALAFSPIQAIDSEPIEASGRHAFAIAHDVETDANFLPRTPTSKISGWAKTKGKNKAADVPFIAEDDTRQSPSATPLAETPESQRPFKELSANTDARPSRKPSAATTDQGAQTSLTAEAIDAMLNAKARPFAAAGHSKTDSFTGSMDTPSTVRIHRPTHSREASLDSPTGPRTRMSDHDVTPYRRPGSAASGRGSIADMPPLPSNHREVIEAARTGSAGGPQSSMGPPLYPASALRAQRPRTPNSPRPPMSPISTTSAIVGTPTPRAQHVRQDSTHGTAEIQSPTRSAHQSRKSSVSSFASEIDTRFNIQGAMGFDAQGFGPNTDPRMIQAITQTMIGEYLWKYTRKAGRGEISENRHRRYFWVHPYTRTLYWSDRDPSTAGRAELRAKSVPIEAVRVVTDDNPMPPGLHRKSLVVISPGRTIKFTCTTGQRHETWFNALSYLLLRTNDDGQNDTEEMVGNMTSADVAEFNPPYGARPRAPPSLSSYNSRTTRNESPAIGMSMNLPTLTPTPHKKAAASRPSIGTLGRISGYWKDSKFGSLRSRSTSGREQLSIYQASEVHDSAEDVRQMIEQQDRESDRLENVRACCDGKHDVGTLPRSSKRGRQSSGGHTHSHPGPSTTTTPAGTLRTRA